MAKKPKVNPQVLAEDYGWAYSFLQSIPELKKLFSKAVADRWSAQRFQAALRNTKWWKTHADIYRQNETLRKTDPATYKARLAATTASLRDMAADVGAYLTTGQLGRISRNAFMYGWTESQLKDALSQYVDNYFVREGRFGGEAADLATELQGLARSNGVTFSDDTLQNWMVKAVAGDETVDSLSARIRQMAASAFPAFAKEINAGVNMADIASPYMESMSRLLEINPGNLDLFDPTIRKALQPAPTTDNQQVAAMPLWQFERSIRQDPRWLNTNNAREALSQIGNQVLKDFGMMG